jgi:hypothetical protein
MNITDFVHLLCVRVYSNACEVGFMRRCLLNICILHNARKLNVF